MTLRRLRFLGLFLCVATIAASCATNPGESNRSTLKTAVPSAKTRSSVGSTTSTAPTGAQSTTIPPGPSLLVEPQNGLTSVYDLMSSARRSLDMTMYELSDATAEQILIADHEKGIRVRVLLDRAYSGGSINQAAYSALSAAGVQVAWANDAAIFHQKTVTVDDSESAIMTGNLTSKYYATTRDFVVMDGQAADVAAIEHVFDSDWSGATPSPGPGGVDLVWSPGSEPQLVALIGAAAHSVTVENEEMDSTAIEEALEADARRGVDVAVVMTSDSEWDSAFARIESAGVHVDLYPNSASALYVHAKAIDVDGAKAFIGSENFSNASLDRNRELGILTSSAGVVGPLSATLSSDVAGGRQQAASSPVPTTTVSGGSVSQTTSGSACYPIDNEGGCYEPGEYCRDDDHGVTGRAGNGDTIICEDKNGWFWELA